MRRFALFAIATLFAQFGIAQPGDAQAKTPCDRACLTGFVDSYFKALLAHDARALPQAAQARITENGAEKKLANTFWDSAAETVFRFDNDDLPPGARQRSRDRQPDDPGADDETVH